jgi:hypothetical protein
MSSSNARQRAAHPDERSLTVRWLPRRSGRRGSGRLAFGHHEDRTPTCGYEPTREAAMAAFAKSWRREKF